MSDNLPRPETPGPWEWGTDRAVYVRVSRPPYNDGESICEVSREQDARAIAALPDWIAAHDAAVARAEKAEAALARIERSERLERLLGAAISSETGANERESLIAQIEHELRHGYGAAEEAA